jgi:hypothetical protein
MVHETNRGELEQYQVRYIPKEFKDLHGKVMSMDRDNWNYKVRNFYEENQFIEA